MKTRTSIWLLAAMLTFAAVPAHADKYDETIKIFKKAGDSSSFFAKSYGYAVFPTVGKGGMVVGGAYGKGRVYQGGRWVGDTDLTQVSVGFQLGGEAYSEIIFFENKAAFDIFTEGNFEMSATAQAMAITAGANAHAGSTGAGAGASASKRDATTAGVYYKGVAVFTIAKGGLMYEASIAGQKFSYSRRK